MPFGTCTRCDRFFALDTERSPQIHCPRCERPLHLLTRAQVVAALRRLQIQRPVPFVVPDEPDPAPPPIPEAEMAILTETLVEVMELARNSREEEGCTCLLHGLCYAEQRRLAGYRWGDGLIQRYFELLDIYSQRYAIGKDQAL